VALDDLELELCQPGRLREDRVGHADLAGVVEETREAEQIEALAPEPQLLAEADGDPLHPQRVAGGVRVLRVDRGVEALDRLERALLEQPVRLDEPDRPGAELLVLAAQRPRRSAHEQREQPSEREKTAPTASHSIVRREPIRWLRVAGLA
jgi:hypothetical protein